jgi:hypothetical protein
MPIEVRCPRCCTALEVPEESQGKTVRCEECKHSFMVEVSSTALTPGPLEVGPAAEAPLPEGAIQGSARPVPPPVPRRRPTAADEPEPRPPARLGRRAHGGMRPVTCLTAVAGTAVVALAAGGAAVWWVLRAPPRVG